MDDPVEDGVQVGVAAAQDGPIRRVDPDEREVDVEEGREELRPPDLRLPGHLLGGDGPDARGGGTVSTEVFI